MSSYVPATVHSSPFQQAVFTAGLEGRAVPWLWPVALQDQPAGALGIQNTDHSWKSR